MQKLTVKNFLTLKDINLDLPKINIIVGPQAEGKSLIAKLIYFFKTFVRDYRNAIAFKETRNEFDKRILKKFSVIFPPYAWENEKFEIAYTFNSHKIILYPDYSKENKLRLNIEYANLLKRAFEDLKAEYSQKPEGKILATDENRPDKRLEERITSLFAYDHDYDRWEHAIFIPSGRAFLATLQKNLGKPSSYNALGDYFLREFGTIYDRAKNFYQRATNEDQERLNPEVRKLIEEILHGAYIYENNEDWIRNSVTKVNLSDASSGQQEVLPVSLVLSFLTAMSNQSNPHFVFIEEPEAHLFPTSQRKIVDLISLTYHLSHRSTNFFITTHSPYILMTLNNLIQAYDTLLAIQKSNKENKKELVAKLYETIPQNRVLPFNDLAAFAIHDGQLEDVRDYDNKIIDAHKIDDVASELNETFGDLVNLQFEVS